MQPGTRWVRIGGWLGVVLGLVRTGATPLVYPANAGDDLVFLYVFLATGAAVILSGLVVLLATRGWGRGERWAWAVLLRTGVFLLILGGGAVVTMADNPFAYLMLIVALVAALPAWVYRRAFKAGESLGGIDAKLGHRLRCSRRRGAPQT